MGVQNLGAAAEKSSTAVTEICADAGVNLKDCYQCGKCAAGCPMAESADMTCREVIRNLQLGLVDEVLASNMPWLCVECANCVTRCPQEVDMPSLNEAICRYAMAQRRVAIKEGPAFMNIFLDNIQKKGVSDEALLAMRFNLSTGHLFQDVPSAPKMMSRGLLSGDGYKPTNAEEIKQMVRKIRSREQQGGDAR